MKLKKTLVLFLVAVFSLSIISFVGNIGEATVEKQYRQGEITKIGPRDYVVASNKQFIEILEITPNDELEQVAEVHGMDNVNDFCTDYEKGKTYLYVATGRYLQKYDISDPKSPKVIKQRDAYDWRQNRRKIGYMRSVACDDQFVYTTGSGGMRSFFKDTLIPNYKFLTTNEAFEMDAAGNRLAIITDQGGEIYNTLTTEQKAVYELENIHNIQRQPASDNEGNIFFPADNSLVRVDAETMATNTYINPVDEDVVHSYAASVAPSGNVYYVNGYGVTKLSNDLEKLGFFFSASNHEYGPNSWAVSIASTEANGGERAVIFNKSSLILVDEDLNFLDYYMYDPLPEYDQGVETELNAKISQYAGTPGSKLAVWAYGFWPNEEIEISLGKNKATVTADNLGFGMVEITAPDTKPGVKAVKVKGLDSNLEYQITYTIK